MGNHDLQTAEIKTDFQLDVPRRLVQEVPEDLRTDSDQLAVYLIQALEIGLKAMAQAGISLDTDFVRAEFKHFSGSLTNMREGLEKLMADELTWQQRRRQSRRYRTHLV